MNPNIRPSFYLVKATVTRKNGAWTHTYQVPLFYLNSRVLGIYDSSHAHQLAGEMLKAMCGEGAILKYNVTGTDL